MLSGGLLGSIAAGYRPHASGQPTPNTKHVPPNTKCLAIKKGGTRWVPPAKKSIRAYLPSVLQEPWQLPQLPPAPRLMLELMRNP